MDTVDETTMTEATEPELKLRSYQQEMLDLSLQRNVIVAMDTGSGKTHVATFRIQVELERSSKLVWFIAPKVELSLQQYAVLSKHLPGYLVKTLLGSDGVDKWTGQILWDAALKNVRVVVGTPAVLADALTHGFVHMSQLALLIFDEAHNCIGKSPMSRIMTDFYHKAKTEGDGVVPHILGLSASPVISAKSTSLHDLEGNLDAVAVTPKQYLSELQQHVHPPEVTHVTHAPAPTYGAQEIPCCTALLRALQDYDFSTDPYVVELRELEEAGDGKATRNLEKVQLKQRTWCFDQLSAIRRKSVAISEQVGASAAEWYITECRKQFLESLPSDTAIVQDIGEKERSHLGGILETIPASRPESLNNGVSPKVQALMETLVQQSSSSSATRALIFAEQRAVILALAHVLKSMPRLTQWYSFGTFIGTSTSDKRKTAVADLVDLKAQSQDLQSFRSDGRKNVILSTSVLEEGIDVSACNLVICFDPPKNLVAFVQRRGRARQQHSQYIMFVSENQSQGDADKFARLENKMKDAYKDERRQSVSRVQDDDTSGKSYRVESTGALLNLDNAKAHLYHFCQISANTKYVDARPEFSTEKDGKDLWTASVTLPSFVHASLRSASATDTWSREENAIKDAAFEAYVSLRRGGLVNDNLLPLTRDYGPDPGEMHVDQPSIVSVAELNSTWREFAQLAASLETEWHASPITLRREDGTPLVDMLIYLPTVESVAQSVTLHWNEFMKYMVEIGQPGRNDAAQVPSDDLRGSTDRLLRSVYGSRMDAAGPADLPFALFNAEILQNDPSASAEATQLLGTAKTPADCGLVHVKGQTGRAYFLANIIKPTDTASEATIVATAFPKRRDFLHPPNSGDKSAASTAKQTLSMKDCTVDSMPSKYALLAAFVPSILHRMDITLLASDLQHNVLRNVKIENRDLIVEAISSPSAQETSDYNRLEFLGDAVLKFCGCIHVMAKHPTWPEGYLGLEKFRLVSNKSLAKAALSAGLDKYILLKPFTGAKWRPPYANDLLSTDGNATREMSSKVLADVVEALIGAAFVDGGLEKAYLCICTLLPDEDWIPLPDCISRIVAETAQGRHVELKLVEQLVGHTLNRPELLIEALTHPSCPHSNGTSSYERLEFLGDAVLDLIIVPKLFAHERKPRHWDLHRMRDALANGDFLAYCCMQYSVSEEKFDVVSEGNQVDIQQSTRAVQLHDFLRAGAQLQKSKRQCLETSEPHLSAIKSSLENGIQYPWPDLIAFNPPKFFSDIVESTLAALYLDSGGDLSVCEGFLNKLGIFDEMRRILDDHVETAYPKEQLGILADREQVDYICSSHIEGGVKVFDCTAKVGDENVATVEGYTSREEAELRAACEAVAVLQGRLGDGKDCGRKKRKLDVAMHHEINGGPTGAGASKDG